jgi:hypothetical protein
VLAAVGASLFAVIRDGDTGTQMHRCTAHCSHNMCRMFYFALFIGWSRVQGETSY